MNQPFDVYGNQGPRTVPSPAPTDLRYGHTVTQVDPLGNPIPHAPQPHQPNGGNFSVPAGTAQQAAQQPEPQPTIIDSIASDAKAAERKVEFPPGAPKLRPIHTLPFRERGNAMRLFGELQKIQGPVKGEEPSFDQIADMYDGLARIDDFLAAVAEDANAYRKWVAGPGNDEGVFSQLWQAYSTQRQPGEASSSSS
jgi:hypothetical protein